MKKIGVLTSGGDAPGMNAAIRAVVKTAIANGIQPIGFIKGYNGILEKNYHVMDRESVSGIIHSGGTILKTARCMEFYEASYREKAFHNAKEIGLDGLVVIGGDGSYRGAGYLSELGLPCIGVPGTIDNDLAYTDYTIGYFTAIETVIDAIGKIRDTSSSHERVNIVEVMGRHCGDLALYSGLAGGAETIILPEHPESIEGICDRLETTKKRGKKHSIIVLAEGVGNAHEIGKQIAEKTGSDLRVTILGHVQRGGSPSAFDRILASKLGVRAVELLLDGKSARVVGVKDDKVIDMDIHEALAMKKEFDKYTYKMTKILSI